MAPVVTLLTDFGLEDSYVAEMKAVLISQIPKVQIVDITHDLPPFQVESGAFQLFRSYHYFPKGTVHLAVIDPGVGTDRKAIYVKSKKYHFVGPDNGLLKWVVQDCEHREGGTVKMYEIPNPEELTPTFHGRDLFSPFVCQLFKKKRKKLKALKELVGKDFPRCRELNGVRRGEIIGVDHFGNVITSVTTTDFAKAEAQIEDREEKYVFAENYLSIKKDKVALIRGSHGFWELAAAKGSAWEKLQVGIGDEVTVYPLT